MKTLIERYIATGIRSARARFAQSGSICRHPVRNVMAISGDGPHHEPEHVGRTIPTPRATACSRHVALVEPLQLDEPRGRHDRLPDEPQRVRRSRQAAVQSVAFAGVVMARDGDHVRQVEFLRLSDRACC